MYLCEKISVIIPIYNAEDYLEECLDSVFNNSQFILEVICVDDGSDDSSVEILNNYKMKNDKLLIVRQKHKGLSAARNNGLSKAKGEYIYFVDADDLVKEKFLGHALQISLDNKLDVLLFSFQPICNDGEMEKKYSKLIHETKRNTEIIDVSDGKDVIVRLYNAKEYIVTVWIQLVKRQFLAEHKLRFYEGIIFEDNLYTFELLLKARRVMCIKEIGYYKRFRRESICTVPENEFNVISFLITLREMKKFDFSEDICFNNVYEQIIDDINQQIVKRYKRLNMHQRECVLEAFSGERNKVIELCEKI